MVVGRIPFGVSSGFRTRQRCDGDDHTPRSMRDRRHCALQGIGIENEAANLQRRTTCHTHAFLNQRVASYSTPPRSGFKPQRVNYAGQLPEGPCGTKTESSSIQR
jgi:hypothetical protein